MKQPKNDNTIVKKVVNEQTGEERIITLHRDHAKPTTRREFLATGMLGFSGMMVAPSILNVLARPEFAFGAAADGQCSVAGDEMPAFVTVNLAGGASLSGNLPPLGEDGEPLLKYDLLGLGPDQGVFTDAAKGRELFQGVRVAGTGAQNVPAGHFWYGLGLRASASTIAKTTLLNVCVVLGDDTSSNQIEASGLIMAAGVSGSLLPNLGNSNNAATGTGVGQTSALIKPAAPLIVSNFNDIANSLRPAATLGTRLSEPRRRKLLELVNSLSGAQARTVASPGSATGTMLAKVVECATGKNIELSSSTPDVDPAAEPSVLSTWGANANNKGTAQYSQAAMVYNALKGNAATVGINDGGYDYHGNGRNNQNAADQRGGEIVGKILETAAILNKRVMINVTSDGSVSSNGGTAFGGDYSNDSGSRGMSYIIMFDPAGRPAVKTDAMKHQIGFYTPGQGASDSSAINSAQKAAVATLANYLAFAGKSAKLDSIAPGVFQRNQLDEVIRLAGS